MRIGFLEFPINNIGQPTNKAIYIGVDKMYISAILIKKYFLHYTYFLLTIY